MVCHVKLGQRASPEASNMSGVTQLYEPGLYLLVHHVAVLIQLSRGSACQMVACVLPGKVGDDLRP